MGESEDERLHNLFHQVCQELGFDDIDLEVIAPEKSDENWIVNEMAGEVRWELLPSERVVC